jgi:hypothetical protein
VGGARRSIRAPSFLLAQPNFYEVADRRCAVMPVLLGPGIQGFGDFRRHSDADKRIGAGGERGQVKAWTEAGYSQDDIAARLDVDPKTLRKHCREELDFGAMDLLVNAVGQLGRMCVGAPAQFDEAGNRIREEVLPQLGAICFLLKTRGKKLGWSERLEVTGKDGAPVAPVLDLSQLSDEQLSIIQQAQEIVAALADRSASSESN